MHSRKSLCAAVAALVSLLFVQSASYAGAGSKGFYPGKVRYFGWKNFKIKQPTPPVQVATNVNVKDFGATGNGTTNDAPAIQNAIAAAKASGQGVFFPPGTYLHTTVIQANGVALIGAGGGTTLLANTFATAVILSGVSPSIQNLVLNSVPAGGGATTTDPNMATLAVVGATNFNVQGITIVQGTGRPGVFLQQSAVGQVTSVTFTGSGGGSDFGVLMDGCANTSIIGNSFTGESSCIVLGVASNFTCNSIAIIANSINASTTGILIQNGNTLLLDQNSIQLPGVGNPIFLFSCTNYLVQRNSTFGGANAVVAQNLAAGQTGIIAQNVFRNCGGSGAVLQCSGAGSAIQFLSNQFGECGTTLIQPVIGVNTLSGPDSVPILNNVYAGHGNMLNFYVQSVQHLNVVSGNAQTQSVLGNSIP